LLLTWFVHVTGRSKKTKRKKSKAAKAKVNGEATETNGLNELPEPELEAEDVEIEDASETPERRDSTVKLEANRTDDQILGEHELPDDETNTSNGNSSLQAIDESGDAPESNLAKPEPPTQAEPVVVKVHDTVNNNVESPLRHEHDEGDQIEFTQNSDTQGRLAAAAKDRDQLKAEVTELRKSLEEIQQRHQEELSKKECELEETRSGKEHAETRYQKLLGQVNVIKAQLGERLKADAVGNINDLNGLYTDITTG